MRLSKLLLCFFSLSLLAAEPDLRLRAGTLTATSDAPQGTRNPLIDVIERENCAVADRVKAPLKLPAYCEMLRGVYHYETRDLHGQLVEVAIEFALTRKNPNSHTLINYSPLYLVKQ